MRSLHYVTIFLLLGLCLNACADKNHQILEAQSTQQVIAIDNHNTVDDQAKYDLWQSYADDLSDDEINTLRISLGLAQGIEVSAEDLLQQAFGQVDIQFDAKADGKLREGFTGSVIAQKLLKTGQNGVLRIEHYQLKTDLEPLKALSVHSIQGLSFPFKMSLGSQIRFVRLFETQTQAQQAPLLTPLHLPFDIERALALPQDCIVDIPIQAQINLQANGQLLSKAVQYASKLNKFLNLSTQGFLSSTPQGSLLMQSHFKIWLIRGSEAHVRIKIHHQRSQDWQAQLQTQAGIQQKITFVPLAHVEKVKRLKDQMIKWGKTPGDQIRSLQKNIERLSKGLPRAIQLLLQYQPVHIPENIQQYFDQAIEVTDQSLELLQKGAEIVDAADVWIKREIEQRLTQIDQRLNPAFDWVKKHSEKALNLSAHVSLNTQLLKRMNHVADYTLDLNLTGGQLAFQSLMSGRIQWEGLQLNGWKKQGFIDLTWADALAQEPGSGVRKYNEIKLEQTQNINKIQAISPVISAHLNRDLSTHMLEIQNYNEQGESSIQSWYAEVWRQDQSLQAREISQTESWSSGLIYPKSIVANESLEILSPWQQGAYWFSWVKQWPAYENKPVTRSLTEMLNLSGTTGSLAGIPSLYQDDVAGELHTHFTMIFDGVFLEYFFNEVDPELIWVAAGQMAQMFDNQFGLPFLTSFSRPTLETNIMVESCEHIAYEWGGRYCWILYEDVIEPLLALRDVTINSDLDEYEKTQLQQEYLSQLYQTQLLANPIGVRVVTRLLAEIASISEHAQHVHFQIQLQHPTYPSSVINSQWSSFDHSMINHEQLQSQYHWYHVMKIAQHLGLATHINWMN